MGHSMSDPGNYRTRVEIEKHQERDPLKLFKATLEEAKILSADEAVAIENEVKAEVDEAVKFAEESAEPDPQELFTNIYANPQVMQTTGSADED
jgi:pyruvate dehydrogenase E1 component alpha subunit